MSKKLFALLMAIVLVVGMSSIAMAECGAWFHQSYAQNLETANEYSFDYVADEATCKTAEVRHYKCASCKEIAFSLTVGDPLGHDLVNGKCSRCGKIACPECDSESVHTNKKSYVAATCDKDGKQDYDCLECGNEWKITFPKLGGHHSWIEYPELSVPSTCVERGLKGEQCKKCGYTRTIDALLNPKNHAHIKTVKAVAPTCAKPGMEAYEMCADCEVNLTEPKEIPVSTEHSDVITHTKKATCTEEGSVTTYCDECDTTLSTEVLKKLGHNLVDGVCTVCGNACDAWFHQSYAQTDEYKHLFNKDTIEATCDDAKVIWYKCASCGQRVFFETVGEKLDHDFVDGKCIRENCGAKDPNYAEPKCEHENLKRGYKYDDKKHWQICADCDEVVNVVAHRYSRKGICICGNHQKGHGNDHRPEHRPQQRPDHDKQPNRECKEHKWDEGRVIVKATCTEAGTMQYKCEKCRKEKTKEIPATGHDIHSKHGKKPTCTKDGRTSSKFCTKCETVIEESKKIPATGHSYTEKVNKKKHVIIHICKNCGHSYETSMVQEAPEIEKPNNSDSSVELIKPDQEKDSSEGKTEEHTRPSKRDKRRH